MGRIKQSRVNSSRARTRARAYGTFRFVAAEPNWSPRFNPRAALAKIGAEISRRQRRSTGA